MLRIYNTLTRTKEEFRPIEPGHVRMYVCGMTVYDYCHLGHARVLVAFDAVARYLRSLGYRVTYVRNITDIDDKIIARANENGEDFRALTERFTGCMHEDCRALGVLAPDVEPRATHYIGPIVAMVERLLANGAAYRGANGDVYYDVSAFPAYGALSDRRLEDLRSGARVEVDEAKDDPLDFVLWKASKPGEPSWESPWGPGRPGWHIECSAMSTSCLGDHFDIHGGGMDLQFPHHENEIAQSEAATGAKFVNVWMHNGFVRIDDEKMSKSLGNFFTLRGVLERYPAEAVRCFMLSSHYRSPAQLLRGPSAAGGRLGPAPVHGAARARRAGRRAGRGLARALSGRDGRRLQHAGSDLGALRPRPRGQPGARDRSRIVRARWPAGCARWEGSSGFSAPIRTPGCAACPPARVRTTTRSSRWSRGGSRPGRAGTGPRRIGCATSWPPRGSFSRTERGGRCGGEPAS